MIPTLGVYDNADEIDFEKLPDKFVLKCTHDSGGIVICKDKSKLDIAKARLKLSKGLRQSYFHQYREYPYKYVRPRIIAEEYREDESGNLNDYKFFCFDGEVKCLFVATGRSKGHDAIKFDFFDTKWNSLSIKNGHPNSAVLPKKPENFEQMVEVAAKLSKGFPHVRVDLYNCNGKIYFGEFTFFHFSGIVPFVPEEWDYKLGDWLRLPK